MEFLREQNAGAVVHHQMIANGEVTSKGWTAGLKEKWLRTTTTIVAKLPTLQGGHALGLTHAGSTSWVEPSRFPPAATIRQSFTASNSNSSDPSRDEITQLREDLRRKDEQLRVQSAQLRTQSEQIKTQVGHIKSLEHRRTRQDNEPLVLDPTEDITNQLRGPYVPTPEELKEFVNQLLNDKLAELMREPTNKRPASQISGHNPTSDHSVMDMDTQQMDANEQSANDEY